MVQDKMTDNNNRGKISRREFLKDAGLVVGGAAIGSMALANACGKTTTTTETVSSPVPTTVTVTAPPTTTTIATSIGGQTINLTVNGNAHKAVVDPGWDLQYFLHDILGYYDIKTFCYHGECGSCTVIMNGRPILTCMTLAVDADGATIQTAQAIALAKHPLVASYVKYQCMQCGYCTPGFLTTAKALLDRNASPSDNDIIEALAGNLCRCGTYPQHLLAIHEAATATKGGTT